MFMHENETFIFVKFKIIVPLQVNDLHVTTFGAFHSRFNRVQNIFAISLINNCLKNFALK